MQTFSQPTKKSDHPFSKKFKKCETISENTFTKKLSQRTRTSKFQSCLLFFFCTQFKSAHSKKDSILRKAKVMDSFIKLLKESYTDNTCTSQKKDITYSYF